MLARSSYRVAGLILILPAFIAVLTGCAGGTGNLILEPINLNAGIDNRTRALVEKELGVVKDPHLISYVNRLASALTGSGALSGRNIRVVIYDRYTPNIFAVPGITIYISRGMLALLQNEDELAHILAHEIAHVNLQHSNRQMAPFKGLSFLRLNGVLVDLMISRDIKPLIDIPLNTLIRGYMASHSPIDEFEADTYGQLLAADAGYDPAALPAILNRLKATDKRVPGEVYVPGFFDTHVSELHRIGRLKNASGNIEWDRKPGQSLDSNIFLKNLDGLMVGPNPRRGLVNCF